MPGGDSETNYESPYYEKVGPMWFGMLVVVPGKHRSLNNALVSQWPPRFRPRREEINATMYARMLLVTQPNAWYDESVHTMTMRHVCRRFGHAMHRFKFWETDSLVTHYTCLPVRVPKALGIHNSQILQGITDCCSLPMSLSGRFFWRLPQGVAGALGRLCAQGHQVLANGYNGIGGLASVRSCSEGILYDRRSVLPEQLSCRDFG